MPTGQHSFFYCVAQLLDFRTTLRKPVSDKNPKSQAIIIQKCIEAESELQVKSNRQLADQTIFIPIYHQVNKAGYDGLSICLTECLWNKLCKLIFSRHQMAFCKLFFLRNYLMKLKRSPNYKTCFKFGSKMSVGL